jgi:hypothetical protein
VQIYKKRTPQADAQGDHTKHYIYTPLNQGAKVYADFA